jgi:hypothetical protein
VQGDNEVDLYTSTEIVELSPNGTGTLTFTVGNYGPNATVGPVRVVVVMPFWANAVGTAAQPPAGFTFLKEDKQPNIPEILEHVITDRLAPKEERTLQVPLELLPGGPRVPGIGRVIVHVGKNSGDKDKTLSQNVAGFTMIRSVPPPAAGTPQGKNEVNLYWVHETIALGPEDGGLLRVHVGNAGPNPTTEDATLVVRTPFYVNVNDKVKLPTSVTMAYENKDPEVPELVAISVNPGLQPGVLHTVEIPLVSAPGGPSGPATAMGLATPRLAAGPGDDPKDFDIDYSPNLHRFVVVRLRRTVWA